MFTPQISRNISQILVEQGLACIQTFPDVSLHTFSPQLLLLHHHHRPLIHPTDTSVKVLLHPLGMQQYHILLTALQSKRQVLHQRLYIVQR